MNNQIVDPSTNLPSIRLAPRLARDDPESDRRVGAGRTSFDDLLTDSLVTPLRVDVTAAVMGQVRRQRLLSRLIPWASALLALGAALSIWQFWLIAHEQSLWDVLRMYSQEFSWQSEFLTDVLESVGSVFPATAFTLIVAQVAALVALRRWSGFSRWPRQRRGWSPLATV